MKFVIAMAFAAPLFAQPCTYVVTPASFNIGAAVTPGSVLVTQTPGSACGSYIASTKDKWLHINEPSGGLPGSSITFTADANLGAAQRVGGMVIGLQTVTVTQAGANCAFGMTPAKQTFPVGGGPGVLNVQANCSWTASSNASWLSVSAFGISDTTVAYSVAPNICVSPRDGTITLQTSLANPPTLAVTQDGSPANISLSAYSATAGPAASNDRITVTTGLACPWSASSDVSWISITVGSSGTGNGGISYHLLENTSAQRTGSIRVGALTYTITQLAPAPPPVVLSAVANAANYGTDAGSPVACAAGHAAMDVIEEEKLCDRANEIGEIMRATLAGVRDRNRLRCIGDIRGLGAMIAFELVKDGDAARPDADLTKALVQAAARRGLIILSCGVRSNVIRLLVPLTAPDAIVKEGLTILEQALLEVVPR